MRSFSATYTIRMVAFELHNIVSTDLTSLMHANQLVGVGSRVKEMENPTELLDLSDELLLQIFSNFNEIDLLTVAAVCKRFEVIAKEVFAGKYNGETDEKYYEIKLSEDSSKYEQRLHRKMIETFGNEIGAIKLDVGAESNRHKLITLIGQQCRSTKYVIIKCGKAAFQVTHMIHSMTSLFSLTLNSLTCSNFYWADIHYPQLKSFCMDSVKCVDVEVLKRFMYINPQLEHLCIVDCRKFPLKVIQALRTRMKTIKSLKYESGENDFKNNCRDIEMEQLESLELSVFMESLKIVLAAIAKRSKKIKQLKLCLYYDGNEEGVMHQHFSETIQLFNGLTSLHLKRFDLSINGIGDIAQHLPQLVSLHVDGVRLNEITSIDILYLFTICKHLKELSLQSKDYILRAEQFDSKFHRKFVDLTRHRGVGVKFEVVQPLADESAGDKILITNEQIIRNGKLIRWIATGCEAFSSQKVHFFDLDEKCLTKIYSYLDEPSERALYETCTRTKAAMHDRINAQLFTVHNFDNAKDAFDRFGKNVTKLSIDMNTNNRTEINEIWKLVSRNYNEGILELSLNNVRVDAMENDSKPKFPNLKTLKIMSLIASKNHYFPPMECPKLAHIEFDEGKITLPIKASSFGITLNQLKSIKLAHFSDNIEKMLNSLNDRICGQIQTLTVEDNPRTIGNKQRIVHMIARFRNLATLNFIAPMIETTNTKYLFESCTQLVKILLRYNSGPDDLHPMLQHIKLNCRYLEEFQIMDDCEQFNRNVVAEIVKALPTVKCSIIHHDTVNATYKIETLEKITKLNRTNPF